MNHGIIKKDRVVLTGSAPGNSGAAAPGQTRQICAKSARPLMHEGRVRAIEITCSCGEKTLVELELEEKNTT